jgi:hypothetical protein
MRNKQIFKLITTASIAGIFSTIAPVILTQKASATTVGDSGSHKIFVCHVNPSLSQVIDIDKHGWDGHDGHSNDYILSGSNYIDGDSCSPTPPAGTPTMATAKIPVSVELFLSIDVSGSVDTNEFNLQKNGYVQAFKSQEIKDGIARLPDGMAVAVQYWGSNPYNPLAVNWRIIKNAADAEAFATTMASTTRPGGGGTNIKGAVDSAKNSLLNNNYEGRALVLDVSGDGISKDSPGCGKKDGLYSINCQSLRDSRDSAVKAGITINGLPINNPNPDANAKAMFEDQIDVHYRDNLIGGNGAFLEKASGFGDFGRAVQLKIEREIEEAEKRIQTTVDGSDPCGCTINGTSKANSNATVKLSTANNNIFDVTYQVAVNADGQWILDLKTAKSTQGTLPKLTKQPMKAKAIGVNGNESQVKEVYFNNVAPEILTEEDEVTDTIIGTAVPNINLKVKLDTDNNGQANYNYSVKADSEGKWTLNLSRETPAEGQKPRLIPEIPTLVTVEDECSNASGNVNITTQGTQKKPLKLSVTPD